MLIDADANKSTIIRLSSFRVTTISPAGSTTPHIYDPKRMADILSAQYQSVFSTPCEDMIVENPNVFFSSDLPANIDSLVDITFSAEDVIGRAIGAKTDSG